MPVRLAATAAAFITALAAALVTPLPASAAPFMAKHGHWSVMSASALACMAMNRPPEEFNFAPFNALALRARRDGGARLQVFAWPGVFKQGQAVTIAVIIDGTRTELAAEAADTYYAQTRDALPAALIEEMRRAPSAQFRLAGVPELLLFDLSDFDAVLKSLDECVRQLPN